VPPSLAIYGNLLGGNYNGGVLYIIYFVVAEKEDSGWLTPAAIRWIPFSEIRGPAC
jgi:hypothetical protein